MTVIQAASVFEAKAAYDEARKRIPRTVGRKKKKRTLPWCYEDEVGVQRARQAVKEAVGAIRK